MIISYKNYTIISYNNPCNNQCFNRMHEQVDIDHKSGQAYKFQVGVIVGGEIGDIKFTADCYPREAYTAAGKVP